MIRIGICDDSSAFLQQTKFMIDHWENKPDGVVAQLFEDGDALLQAHEEHPFDIILLDIVMPRLGGMEAARALRESDKTVKIVFLTASAEYAVDSYAVKASDYLLKPIQPFRLFSCLEELIAQMRSTGRCIVVKSAAAVHRVDLSDIEYVEAQNKHVLFALTGGRSVTSTDPLYSFEHKLELADGFYKCHRSYVVNIHHIDSFSQKEIVMRSGCRVPIARGCRKEFEAVYFAVVFGKAGEDA